MAAEVLEALANDERIVRNLKKIRTVPDNARMIVDAAREHGRFGAFLEQWPSEDQAGQQESLIGGTASL